MWRSLWVWGVAIGLGGAEGLATAQTAGQVEVVRLPAGDLQPQVVIAGHGVQHRLTFRGDPAAGDVWYARRGPEDGCTRSGTVRPRPLPAARASMTRPCCTPA